jgi:hypothetical protein
MMRKPSKKKQDDDCEQVPPGGRAFQRLLQDRAARGLPLPPAPGTEDVEKQKLSAKSPAKKSRRKKTVKR